MIRILATVFAGLLGLAFGSFLNVCVSRWPKGESVVKPRSHCRACGRTLKWWENVPLVSWLALRGRCRTCGVRISVRYPLVELAVGGLWATLAWRFLDLSVLVALPEQALIMECARAAGRALFCWLMIALAVLDAEHLWLPDRLTWPGMALGVAYSVVPLPFGGTFALFRWGGNLHVRAAIASFVSTIAAAALMLLIRWLYWLIRRREGLGLGDVKLMAMIAAWLGLSGALLSLFLGVVLGALVAVIALTRGKAFGMTKLPLGTFLCIGGIVSALWGEQILNAYLRWSGF
jgi:leader peptidase (prepilin peptidase)/N-methyltransferase